MQPKPRRGQTIFSRWWNTPTLTFFFFFYHWRELPQVSFLSRRNTYVFCCDKSMLLLRQRYACRNKTLRHKHTFFATKDVLSRQTHISFKLLLLTLTAFQGKRASASCKSSHLCIMEHSHLFRLKLCMLAKIVEQILHDLFSCAAVLLLLKNKTTGIKQTILWMLNTNSRMHKQNRIVNNRYCLSLGANTAASCFLFSLFCLLFVSTSYLLTAYPLMLTFPLVPLLTYANFSTGTATNLWAELAQTQAAHFPRSHHIIIF